MRLRTLGMLSLALVACADEDPFISLRDLCFALSQDVCEARDGCCGGGDVAACIMAEEPRCMAALAPYEQESTLRYDAARALRQRDAARAVLDACGGAPNLANFFEGGLPGGAPCERGAQCASGACTGEPRVCAVAAGEPLCRAP